MVFKIYNGLGTAIAVFRYEEDMDICLPILQESYKGSLFTTMEEESEENEKR